MANITVTYSFDIVNSSKDHPKNVTFSATVRRTSPATLNTNGMTVTSATINMTGTTFWSASGNNPYLNIGNFGRVYVNTGTSNKAAIPLTIPSSSFSLNNLLSVGTSASSSSIYAYKSSSGNICTYPSNFASFTITAICKEGYTKSTATVTSNVEAGDTCLVSISNSNISALHHKVTWSLGSFSHMQNYNAGVSNVGFTIPEEWLQAMPNATSAGASVKVETLDSSNTSLGYNNYTFTLTAPATAVPTITLAIGRYNNAVPQSWNVWVQGKSGIQITATSAGYQGSTIVNYAISGGASWTQTSNVFSINPINGSGDITYTIRVMDSRGRTASASYTVTVCPYAAPTFSSTMAFRCNNAGTANENGTYANVTASGAISSVNGKNIKTITAAYAASGSSTFSSETTLTDGETSVIGGNLDTSSSYQVRFTISDQFGSVEKLVTVSTAAYTVFFKEGGNAVAFGKVAEHNNALEINSDWAIYHGEERLDGTVPISRGGTGATTASGACTKMGAVKKAGDTMTGNLSIQTQLYPSMNLIPTNNGTTNRTVFEGSYVGASSFAAWNDAAGASRRMLEVRNSSYESSLDNAVMLRDCVNGVWGNYRVFHAGMPTGVPVSKGGTGATTAANARSNLGANNAANLTTGTLPAARLPFKFAYGSTNINGSSATSISYSSAGFTAVPVVLVTYSTTGSNWSGDNGAIKVHSKTKTGCSIVVGGNFSTSRAVDWFAFGV